MDIVTLPALWVPIISAFIPLIAALAVRQDGSNAIRALIAVIASAAIAVIDVVTGSGATVNELLSTFGTALAVELVFYAAIWGPIVGINNIAPNVGIGGAGADTPGMSAG